MRHFTERVGDGLWEVVCLSREVGAGQGDKTADFGPFEGHPLPVVLARLCGAAGKESFEWIVVETGEVAIELILGNVRRNLDGRCLVPARTSTGTIDYTEYDLPSFRSTARGRWRNASSRMRPERIRHIPSGSW